MHHKCSRATALLITAAAAFYPSQIVAAVPSDYSILYTGRLFGYFRYPNIQELTDKGCPAGGASIAAQEFQKEAPLGKPDEIRVAMGDNFSPEVFATKLYDADHHHFVPRSLYFPYGLDKDHLGFGLGRGGFETLRGNLPSDSVGCFLQQAHFAAVVPGKDDFYLGPEHVSDLARFLHQSHGDLPAVEMLAANLIVSTAKHTPGEPLPNDELETEVAKLLKDSDLFQIKLPKDVLPWLREVTVEFRGPADARIAGELCLAKDRDPNACLRQSTDSPRRMLAVPVREPAADQETTKLTFPLEIDHSDNESRPNFILIPDRNYAFCVWEEGKDQRHCQTFTVRQPMFQVCDSFKKDLPCDPGSGDKAGLGSRIAIDNSSPKPYSVPATGPLVAVFGVVDPAMMKQVGLLNYSWANEDANYDTLVKVIDPAESLEQALSMCEHDKDCRDKQKVLLAQMPLARARSVIEKLQESGNTNPFDVVLTQVDQQDYTGSATLTTQIPARGVKPAPQREIAHEVDPRRPLFLVPADHSAQGGSVHQSISVQRAALCFKQKTDEKDLLRVTLTNRVLEYPLTPQVASDVDQKLLDFEGRVRVQFGFKKSADSMPVSTEKGVKTPYEYLAMNGMRKYCHADIAIIQPRDIYEHFGRSARLWPVKDDRVPPDSLFTDENFLEEAIWKGDLVICRTITGADLKASLAVSDANEQTSYRLMTLGVEKDAVHDNYIVAGEVLDEKRYYVAAMTDFLAYGDTNYPTLSASDLGAADTIRSLKEYVLVTDVVEPTIENRAEVYTLPFKSVYDEAHTRPPADPPTDNFVREIGDWWKHWILAYDYSPTFFRSTPRDAAAKLRTETERGGSYYFNLETLNLFSELVSINGPQQQVPNRFGGITSVPQLQVLESQTVTAWGRVRFGRVFSAWVDFYNVAEGRYAFARNRQTADATGYDPYTVSVAENVFTYETGLLTKRLSAANPIRFLLSERLSTQMRAPLLNYSAPVLSPAPGLANAATPHAAGSSQTSNCKVTGIDIESPITATSTANILCSSPRSELLLTKAGIRLENRDSWIETGWEFGHNYNSTTGYIFNKNTSYQVDCPAASQSLATCIANNPVTNVSPLYVTHQTLPVSGIFLNFKIAAPVYEDKIRFSIENYTEVFRGHSQDTSADTRFYQDLVASLPIKIWQNLSVAPQVEMFYFQNKKLPQHFLSLTSQLTLQYSFPWHSGMSWRKALTLPYPSAGAKSSTLPAP